jgi:hypothetical protein
MNNIKFLNIFEINENNFKKLQLMKFKKCNFFKKLELISKML